jgi:hypothetical protein
VTSCGSELKLDRAEGRRFWGRDASAFPQNIRPSLRDFEGKRRPSLNLALSGGD